MTGRPHKTKKTMLVADTTGKTLICMVIQEGRRSGFEVRRISFPTFYGCAPIRQGIQTIAHVSSAVLKKLKKGSHLLRHSQSFQQRLMANLRKVKEKLLMRNLYPDPDGL